VIAICQPSQVYLCLEGKAMGLLALGVAAHAAP
jgi:hypothetical protein